MNYEGYQPDYVSIVRWKYVSDNKNENKNKNETALVPSFMEVGHEST